MIGRTFCRAMARVSGHRKQHIKCRTRRQPYIALVDDGQLARVQISGHELPQFGVARVKMPEAQQAVAHAVAGARHRCGGPLLAVQNRQMRLRRRRAQLVKGRVVRGLAGPDEARVDERTHTESGGYLADVAHADGTHTVHELGARRIERIRRRAMSALAWAR